MQKHSDFILQNRAHMSTISSVCKQQQTARDHLGKWQKLASGGLFCRHFFNSQKLPFHGDSKITPFVTLPLTCIHVIPDGHVPCCVTLTCCLVAPAWVFLLGDNRPVRMTFGILEQHKNIWQSKGAALFGCCVHSQGTVYAIYQSFALCSRDIVSIPEGRDTCISWSSARSA